MKKSFFQNHQMIGLLCGAAALAAAALAPQSASAAGTPGTAANAKILNVVTVNYSDATGKPSYQAATSTSVIVSLKPAALTVAATKPFPTVDSGQTTTTYIALTSNANGPDNYTVSYPDLATNLVVNASTASLVTDIGGTPVSFSNPVILGATSIVSVDAPSGSGPTTTQKIYIPAGTLNNIAANSIVVIGTTSCKVTATTLGSVAMYSTTGTQSTTGTLTGETLGTITITADPNDSNTPPNLTSSPAGALAGTIIGERKYLQITETATNSTNNTATPGSGTDLFTINSASSTGNLASAALSETATFNSLALSIIKTVTNVTKGGSAGATGQGQPGDVLEYAVTVTNTATGNAKYVSITDAVPAYTTLVSGGTSLGTTLGSGAATDKFATIFDGTNTVDITLDPTDSEPQPGTTVGYGGTAGHATAAGTAINFYLGTGSGASTGGTVTINKTYIIKYRVMIN